MPSSTALSLSCVMTLLSYKFASAFWNQGANVTISEGSSLNAGSHEQGQIRFSTSVRFFAGFPSDFLQGFPSDFCKAFRPIFGIGIFLFVCLSDFCNAFRPIFCRLSVRFLG
jgi:hypothetical protein